LKLDSNNCIVKENTSTITNVSINWLPIVTFEPSPGAIALAPPRIELNMGANDSRRNLNLFDVNMLPLLPDDIPLSFRTIYLLRLETSNKYNIYMML
jgi:hypothetical protein